MSFGDSLGDPPAKARVLARERIAAVADGEMESGGMWPWRCRKIKARVSRPIDSRESSKGSDIRKNAIAC